MHHISCSFLVNHQITQVTQLSYSPDLVPRVFWLCPKLKSPLQGKRFQTLIKIQENTMGQLMAIGRTVWGPEVLTLKGTEVSLSYIHCFYKCLYFSYYMPGYLLDRPRVLQLGWTLKHCKWKKTVTKGHILYDTIWSHNMECPELANHHLLLQRVFQTSVSFEGSGSGYPFPIFLSLAGSVANGDHRLTLRPDTQVMFSQFWQ